MRPVVVMFAATLLALSCTNVGVEHEFSRAETVSAIRMLKVTSDGTVDDETFTVAGVEQNPVSLLGRAIRAVRSEFPPPVIIVYDLGDARTAILSLLSYDSALDAQASSFDSVRATSGGDREVTLQFIQQCPRLALWGTDGVHLPWEMGAEPEAIQHVGICKPAHWTSRKDSVRVVLDAIVRLRGGGSRPTPPQYGLARYSVVLTPDSPPSVEWRSLAGWNDKSEAVNWLDSVQAGR